MWDAEFLLLAFHVRFCLERLVAFFESLEALDSYQVDLVLFLSLLFLKPFFGLSALLFLCRLKFFKKVQIPP